MMGITFSFLSIRDIPRVISYIITLAALLLAYAMSQNDLITLLIFTVLLFVFTIFKFDSRIPIGYAIILLVVSAVLTFLNVDDSVKRLTLISYWLLVVGIIDVLVDLYRKTKPVQTVS
jgi:hypothetical protein